MRLLLDTNILVSGLLSRKGLPGLLLDAWLQDYRYELVTEARAVVATVLHEVTASPDPDDNLILATAIPGQADAVVSGDKGDVLSLREVEGIPIITAREAARQLGLLEGNSA